MFKVKSKKILSIMLTMMMLVTLVPQFSFAKEEMTAKTTVSEGTALLAETESSAESVSESAAETESASESESEVIASESDYTTYQGAADRNGGAVWITTPAAGVIKTTTPGPTIGTNAYYFNKITSEYDAEEAISLAFDLSGSGSNNFTTDSLVANVYSSKEGRTEADLVVANADLTKVSNGPRVGDQACDTRTGINITATIAANKLSAATTYYFVIDKTTTRSGLDGEIVIEFKTKAPLVDYTTYQGAADRNGGAVWITTPAKGVIQTTTPGPTIGTNPYYFNKITSEYNAAEDISLSFDLSGSGSNNFNTESLVANVYSSKEGRTEADLVVANADLTKVSNGPRVGDQACDTRTGINITATIAANKLSAATTYYFVIDKTTTRSGLDGEIVIEFKTKAAAEESSTEESSSEVESSTEESSSEVESSTEESSSEVESSTEESSSEVESSTEESSSETESSVEESSEEVVKKNIKDAVVTSISSQTYTGKAITPAVTLKGIDVADYSVKYENNTAIGVATVTVTGQNNYEGTVTKNFKIVPAKAKLTKVVKGTVQLTAYATKQTGGVSYQFYVKRSDQSAKYYKTTSTKKVVTKLSPDKYYTVKVRAYKVVDGKTYYGAWSDSTKVKTYKLVPAKGNLSKVTVGTKKLTIYAAKQNDEVKYQYYVKQDGKSAKYYKTSATKKVVEKLISKKYYTVKVRAYKTVNGKTYYGTWSTSKKVKVK